MGPFLTLFPPLAARQVDLAVDSAQDYVAVRELHDTFEPLVFELETLAPNQEFE